MWLNAVPSKKMKLLAFLLFVGFASAASRGALDEATDEVIESFVSEADKVVPLRIALAIARNLEIYETEYDAKTELGKDSQRFLEAIDKRSAEKDDFQIGVRTRRNLLTLDLRMEIKRVLEIVKGRVKDILEEIWNDERLSEIRELLKKLKGQLVNRVEKSVIMKSLEKTLEQFRTEILDHAEIYLARAKEKILDVADNILVKDSEIRGKRSLSEKWEEAKRYFKKLHIDLKEKFSNFGDWAKKNFSGWTKENINKGLTDSKYRLQNLIALGKEFLIHLGTVGKEIGSEGVEFFRQYKDELGMLWHEIRDAANKSKNQD